MLYLVDRPCRTKVQAAEDIAAKLAAVPRYDLLTRARLQRMLQTLCCEILEDEERIPLKDWRIVPT